MADPVKSRYFSARGAERNENIKTADNRTGKITK